MKGSGEKVGKGKGREWREGSGEKLGKEKGR